MAFKVGDRIRFSITGTVGVKLSQTSIGEKLSQTSNLTLVGQDAGPDGDRWTHLLNLDSSSVTITASGDQGSNRASVQFNATVTGPHGKMTFGTTEVTEENGTVHNLFLASSSVTVITGEEPAGAPPAAIPVVKAEVSGARITPYDTEIESKDILARIGDLEDAAGTRFTVTRNRTGNPVTTYFNLLESAEQYLDDNDLNPARFTIFPVTVQLSTDDQEELDQLRKLNEAGLSTFGSTAWITRSVLLRNDDACDSDWVREQAAGKLGISSEYLDEWPLSLIDWGSDGTVSELLSNEYLSVNFGIPVYWGKGTE